MTKLIINTEYSELLRYIFYNLREEKVFPYRDNFFLIKNLSGKEYGMLVRFQNYVIISSNYAEQEWGRQEIFDYVAKRINSRRRPKFDLMSNEEFEKNMKIFLITKLWVSEDEESNMFELYKSIDNIYRLKNYFELRKTLEAHHIFYSLLTFANKAITITTPETVGTNYFKVLLSKKRRITLNLKKALSTYINYDKEINEDLKILRFIIDLGG